MSNRQKCVLLRLYLRIEELWVAVRNAFRLKQIGLIESSPVV